MSLDLEAIRREYAEWEADQEASAGHVAFNVPALIAEIQSLEADQSRWILRAAEVTKELGWCSQRRTRAEVEVERLQADLERFDAQAWDDLEAERDALRSELDEVRALSAPFLQQARDWQRYPITDEELATAKKLYAKRTGGVP